MNTDSVILEIRYIMNSLEQDMMSVQKTKLWRLLCGQHQQRQKCVLALK